MLDNARLQEILDAINDRSSTYDSIHTEISQEFESELKDLSNSPLEEEEYDEIKAIQKTLELDGITYEVCFGYAISHAMEYASVSIQYVFDPEGKSIEPDSEQQKRFLHLIRESLDLDY